MPIDDERKFTVTKRYRAGPERETSQVPVAAALDSGDPLVEGLDELRRVLEASRQECAITESTARQREEAEQARVERDEKFNKLQQMLHRVKELDDQSRQAKAERKLRGRLLLIFSYNRRMNIIPLRRRIESVDAGRIREVPSGQIGQ